MKGQTDPVGSNVYDKVTLIIIVKESKSFHWTNLLVNVQ